MKKALALILALALCVSIFAACTPKTEDGGAAASVTLRVVTSFSTEDGNRANYENAYKAWETATGNTVEDQSSTSNEEWKATVLADFETGSEPDVLFYFNGIDANPFIEAGKVVSIDEIRAVYPDYASNMDDGKIAKSLVDGVAYAVPTTGFWEGLFYNKTVLDAAGVEVPGATTTWTEFMDICQKIKDAGYTPIAASLNEVPHYWFEFCILNNGGTASHLTVPADASDPVYKNWVAGLNDIKTLYDKGFLPANTTTMTDPEANQMIADDQAAFFIDGSWKCGWIRDNVDDISNFGVTYVPGTDARAATVVIAGISMGYYITRKAWDDPAKQAAAVSFVQAMTTDDVVNAMAGGAAMTALKSGTAPAGDPDAIGLTVIAMLQGSTGAIAPVQDLLSAGARQIILPDNMKLVATGEMTAEDSVSAALAAN